MTSRSVAHWLDRAAYPFAHHWQPISDGVLHYLDEGTGHPVLFVHGTPTWSFEYRHLVKALSPSMRCIAPDHLGFGLSDRPESADYSAEAHSRRLAEFVDRIGLERFDLVVHDYGGPIGLPLALARHSRVRRLVLLNTWMWPFDDDPHMRRTAKLAGSGLFRWMYRRLNFSLRVIAPSAYGDRSKLTREIHRQYLSVFPDADSRERVLFALARGLAGEGGFYRSLWEQRQRLTSLPALIVWGMKDTAFRPYNLDRWKTVLPAAKVVALDRAGHWPHEEEPEAVIAAMKPFLLSA